MKRKFFLKSIVALCILLMVYTATSKLFSLTGFVSVLKQSPLLHSFATLIGWLVPLAELMVAGLLFFPATQKKGLACFILLLLFFTIYIIVMLSISSKLPCSCGGVIKLLSWKQHLAFNIFFILLGITGLYTIKREEAENLK